jgi:hypothetical protein
MGRRRKEKRGMRGIKARKGGDDEPRCWWWWLDTQNQSNAGIIGDGSE